MTRGQLSILKTIGNKPTFVILNTDGSVAMELPDIQEWLFARLGKVVSIQLSDVYFMLTDEDKRQELKR